uniref:Uncharacterized protein n=1 Tax=Arundo donax TaxID=35708 RepID=A0A0A9EL78_ARUDO
MDLKKVHTSGYDADLIAPYYALKHKTCSPDS